MSNFLLHSDRQHTFASSLAPVLSCCQTLQLPELGKRSASAAVLFREEVNHGEDELSDDVSQLGEKKRRLNMEQVKTLEINFEQGNKLDHERKTQLARDLGLQPRQVAIWFQNRRARWKTKQLEIDYELLRRQFEAAKAENGALQAQNQKLHAEILALKNNMETVDSINMPKETEGSASNRSEKSSQFYPEISRNPAVDSRHGMLPEFHGPKLDLKEEISLCNMLCGVDDNSGFWPLIEQQNFS